MLACGICSLLLLPVARAGDGSITETLVWPLQGRSLVATYSRDRDGTGTLKFRDATGRRTLPVTWLVQSDRDLVANMSLSGMQHFNGMLVVTLESASGYVTQIYVYDERLDMIAEVASAAGRWQPELMYWGDTLDPAVGIIRQMSNSKGRQPGMICGQKILRLNQSTRRIEETYVRWTARGKEQVANLDPTCTD
ncbi:MAG TPA: hypothetical protein VG994_17850 [Steroidobacteraceae bacterium]|nr:hypothetical protein [Steroidobacteraceae bacterium]